MMQSGMGSSSAMMMGGGSSPITADMLGAGPGAAGMKGQAKLGGVGFGGDGGDAFSLVSTFSFVLGNALVCRRMHACAQLVLSCLCNDVLRQTWLFAHSLQFLPYFLQPTHAMLPQLKGTKRVKHHHVVKN